VVDVDAYRGVVQRIDGVVRVGDTDAAVPCCPGWRVRDVVAHLTGLCEDWVNHDLDGYASDSWTAAQVDRFAGYGIDEILARWHQAMDGFADLDDDPVMGPPARWAFGDAVIHEADIRGALGAARVPHDVVVVALKGAVARWRHVLGTSEAPTLLLRVVDARDWWLGEAVDGGTIEVEASAYEVFRGLAGRRSAEQVRAWTWSGDPEPYVHAGLAYPFQWSTTDLTD
jgi:uncharacterized protein (TIGR03083 family)